MAIEQCIYVYAKLQYAAKYMFRLKYISNINRQDDILLWQGPIYLFQIRLKLKRMHQTKSNNFEICLNFDNG